MAMCEDIKGRVEGYFLRALSAPLVTPTTPTRIAADILGEFTKEVTPQDNALAHYIDLVVNHADAAPANLDELYKRASENNDWSGLLAPRGFKSPPPPETQLQFAILDGQGGAKTILNHIVLKSPERKMKFAPFKELAYGAPRRLVSVHPKIGTKVWQYVFEAFGGKQFRQFFLSPEAKAKATQNAFYEKSDDEINAGFDYIINEAPKSTVGLQQARWQTIAMRAGVPLRGWPIGLVEKSLRSLAAEGALAKKEFGNIVTLCDEHFNLRVLNVMADLISSNLSLVLIGEPSVGKTPLGRAFLMAMCRRSARANGLDPARCPIRVTPEIDFLRGEPGDILMGGFVDDGRSNLLPPKMVKALLDVGRATPWKMGEPRCMADQACDPNAEKLDRWPSVTFKEFFELVRPAFHETATRACMLASLKRAAFLVNTQEHLYWRPPGTEEKDVQRIHFKGEAFLTGEGERLCQLQKDGDMTPPDNFDQLLEKERLLVDSAVEKNRKKSSDAAVGALPALAIAQVSGLKDEAPRGVKREPVSLERLMFRKRLLSGMAINVDSPSPAKQHAAASSSAARPSAPPRGELDVQLSQMLGADGVEVPLPSAGEEEDAANFIGPQED
ncbi:unnamed protein product [Prorocentrum cordatum]|uniref:Uncharacterized protein n=1 Tax=Prorocentrum cordatum TaxID=2364126 RepID=A0ABN9WJX8_9DINO|nr:unnamed protein product [Polarella glacialis]